MSVLDSIKSALGLGVDTTEYECVDCGATFESASQPDGPWFECPECGSEDPLAGGE
ncbi:MAG: zinc ribbon domain-containing protein [Haloarculaceae archaeon]